MSKKSHYDIQAQWYDPFDKPEEKRRSPRFPIVLKLRIAAPDAERKGQMVGPGLSRDLSQAGVRVITKHRLRPRQTVKVAMSTELCSDSMCLPDVFRGTAQVVRVEPKDSKCAEVSLSFENSLIDNIEFAVFVDSLKTLSSLMA